MPIERLSSLAVLHCYKQREIDIEKVIHSFVVKNERRLVFLFATRYDIKAPVVAVKSFLDLLINYVDARASVPLRSYDRLK
jgi:hypothetical protein